MKILIIFLTISASPNNFWEHCSRVPPLFAPMPQGVMTSYLKPALEYLGRKNPLGTTSGVGRNKRVIKAGQTVDGTPLLIQETSLGLFGIGLAPFYRGCSRYEFGTFA